MDIVIYFLILKSIFCPFSLIVTIVEESASRLKGYSGFTLNVSLFPIKISLSLMASDKFVPFAKSFQYLKVTGFVKKFILVPVEPNIGRLYVPIGGFVSPAIKYIVPASFIL